MLSKALIAGCVLASTTLAELLNGREFILEPVNGQAPLLVTFEQGQSGDVDEQPIFMAYYYDDAG